MAGMQFLVVILYVACVIASPRNLLPQKPKRNPGSSGGSSPPTFPHGDTWVPKSDDGPSQYGGSWDHGSSPETSKSQHNDVGDSRGYSSTCAASTVTETSVSTLSGPTSTVYASQPGCTSVLPASTVYISGSGSTSFLPASTVYLSGSGYTSVVPGPAQTVVSTSYETLTWSAPPTTVYVTRFGSGWNHTITREETDVVITTQHDYSTIYNKDTTVLTSVVTLPGTTSTVLQTLRNDITITSVSTAPGTIITEKSIERQTEYAILTIRLPGTTIISTSILPAKTIVQTEIQPASVQTYTERIIIPYTSITTKTLAPITYTSTAIETLPASTTTLVSSYIVPASTIHEITTITSDYISTITSVVAPSTLISYEVSTAPGATITSFYTAPGHNHSVVSTSTITRTVSGPTVVHTVSGGQTTLTEYRTATLPGSTLTAAGGKLTLTEYATRTLPGSITTSIINHPGENSTVTSMETTTCYETVSSCSATPVPPPQKTTVYATNYITKTLQATYTAHATCSDSTVTISASSTGWDGSGSYGSHGGHSGGEWDRKPSGYGEVDASSTGGSWTRA